MLTELQQRVARLFLALPEAERFALAGGAALVLRGDVERRTEDLDFFAPAAEDVQLARDALQAALVDEGMHSQVIRSGPAFARLVVQAEDGQSVLVDLGYDHRMRDAEQREIGPVLALEELAADKLLALSGRAEARDFVDVHALAGLLSVDALLELAQEKDSGFDVYVLATMLDSFDRHRRDEFEVADDDYERLRTFYGELRASLIERSVPPA